MRLRTKLTFVTVIIVVLSIFLSTFFIVFFAKQNTENTILVTAIKDFTAFYYKLSKSQVYFDSEQNSTSSRSFLRYIIMSIPGAEEFVLQQGDTTISNNTGIDAIGILNSNKNSSMSLNDTEIPIRYLFCNVKGVSYFLAVTTITIAHKTYSLSLVRNITVAADSIDTLAVQCLFVGIAVVFVAASCVLLFVRHALKPMKELEIGALEIANGNYGTRIMVKGNDEIAIVAKQFNNMAVAISDKIDTLIVQRSVSNLSLMACLMNLKLQLPPLWPARKRCLTVRLVMRIERALWNAFITNAHGLNDFPAN